MGGGEGGPDTLLLPFAHHSLKLLRFLLTEFLLPPPLAHRTCQHGMSIINVDVHRPRHIMRAGKGRLWVLSTVPGTEEALG